VRSPLGQFLLIIISPTGPLTCFILELLSRDPRSPNPTLSEVANILTWILRFIPSFCLGKGLFHAININTFLFLEDNDELTAWTEPILLYEVYFLAAQCVVFLLLAVQLDRWSTNPRIMSMWRTLIGCFKCRRSRVCWMKSQETRSISPLADDDDVIAEEELVLSGEANTDLISIQKLHKVYDDGKVAVDRISLGISPGEVFGLLGINGKWHASNSCRVKRNRTILIIIDGYLS
jgi:ATP-binding cassette, subfamily A (ABC1), member 3